MKRRLVLLFAGPVMLFGLSTQALQAAPAAGVVGMWSNPKKSVYVRTELCGERLCGEIVCATPRAIEKARAKGAEALVGTKVLENYRQRKDGTWRGKVFVPDRQDRFQSTLTQVSPDQLEIRGCVLGGLICKEQVWHRADEVACGGMLQP